MMFANRYKKLGELLFFVCLNKLLFSLNSITIYDYLSSGFIGGLGVR